MLTNDKIEELREHVRNQISQMEDKALIPHYMHQLGLCLLTKGPFLPVRFPSRSAKISVVQKLEAIRKLFRAG